MGDAQRPKDEGREGRRDGCLHGEAGAGAFGWMDAMRCVLATAVAFAHAWYLLIEDYRQPASLPARAGYFLAGYAHACVILFFVLSGFWITRSVSRRLDGGWRWQPYLIDRLSRLGIVLVPALALGGMLDWIGLDLLGSTTHRGLTDTYVMRPDLADTLSWRTLLGNLLFLQTILVAPFGSNGPLWSLAFEFWFYIWFPALAVSLRSRRPSPLLITAGLIAFNPHLAISFGCWLCGTLLHWANGERDAKAPPPRGWLVLSALMFAVMLVVVRLRGLDGLELPLAAAFAVLLHTLMRVDPALPAWARPLASYGSKASFSLYAVHFPLLALMAGIVINEQRLPPTTVGMAMVAAAVSITVAFCWAFAWCTERHTGRLRDALSRKSRQLADYSSARE